MKKADAKWRKWRDALEVMRDEANTDVENIELVDLCVDLVAAMIAENPSDLHPKLIELVNQRLASAVAELEASWQIHRIGRKR